MSWLVYYLLSLENQAIGRSFLVNSNLRHLFCHWCTDARSLQANSPQPGFYSFPASGFVSEQFLRLNEVEAQEGLKHCLCVKQKRLLQLFEVKAATSAQARAVEQHSEKKKYGK